MPEKEAPEKKKGVYEERDPAHCLKKEWVLEHGFYV